MSSTIDAQGNLHRGSGQGGGQFEGKANSAPAAALDARTSRERYVAARAELIEQGYAPAMAGPSSTDPRSRAGIRRWWDEHRLTAEIRDGAAYAQMPDDFTPSMTGGHALSGHRRTHRMLYEGAGIALRMPSVASIKRFAAESGETSFDVPVEAVGEAGNAISGHVRVTREGAGAWSVHSLNMPTQAAPKITEAVASVLEARRPSMALAAIGDLAESRRERIARTGSTIRRPATQSWITGVGYNQSAGEMVVQIGDRRYGYHVAPDAFEAVANATSPGSVYNRLVKGSERFDLETCADCGRCYNSARGHTCMRVGAASTTDKPYNVRVRGRILAEAGRG